jgi:hypothetical protein
MKRAFLCVFAMLAFGCGDDNPGTNNMMPDAGDTGGSGGSGGSGGTGGSGGNSNYPAFPVDTALIVNNGGMVFASMVIVSVTWNGDPGQATYDQFGDDIGASNYWHNLGMQYGVGPTSSGTANHVHLDPNSVPPPTTDGAARTVITNGITNGTMPTPTNQTLYSIYIPPGTSFQGGCTSFDGYHSELSAAGHRFAYSITAPCNGVGNETITASHEFLEAATDPYVRSGTAWVGFDDAHMAWEVFQQEQDEIGDACEFSATNYFDDHETGFMYTVQRQWSNSSAMAGHNPCVPNPPTPFYGVTILSGQTESITVNLRSLGIATTNTKGFKVAMGQSKTFQVGYFSDMRTPNGAWTLTASVPAMLPGGSVNNGTAMVMIDKTSGLNGDMANVTVTPMSYNGTGGTYIELISHLQGFETHTTPFFIAAQ